MKKYKFSEGYREGDGRDPRYDRGDRKADNRKALQLCSQVKDVLNMALAGMADEVVQNLYVESIQPAPDSTHLLALVRTDGDALVAQQHVSRASGLLRTEVGAGINRKRVPHITFQVMP